MQSTGNFTMLESTGVAPQASSVDIASFVGPCSIVLWVSFILYGLLVAQLYVYCTTYRDKILVRLLVLLLGILETLQVFACMHLLYTYLIIDLANPEQILHLVWTGTLSMSLELVINGLVQSYYVYRIWGLSKNIPITLVLFVELAARTVIGFKATSYSYTHTNWFELAALAKYKIFVTASLSLSVLLDASITSILLFYLNRAQSSAHKRSTRSTLHKLSYYALSTGSLTTLATIITLIVFQTSKSPILYGSLVVIMAKVYANSMLAMLNIRQGLRMEIATGDTTCAQISDIPTRIEIGQATARHEIHITQEIILTDESCVTITKDDQLSIP